MYDFPRRRGGLGGVAGARARPVPVGAHAGSYRDYLRRHVLETDRAARGNSALRQQVVAELFHRAADPRNLMCAWEHLASGEGRTPGTDGMTYEDLEPYEARELLRTVNRAIHKDTYRVQPDLVRQIPKASGHGTRTLRIPTVVDRVVQRAVVQTIQPLLDPGFDNRSP